MYNGEWTNWKSGVSVDKSLALITEWTAQSGSYTSMEMISENTLVLYNNKGWSSVSGTQTAVFVSSYFSTDDYSILRIKYSPYCYETATMILQLVDANGIVLQTILNLTKITNEQDVTLDDIDLSVWGNKRVRLKVTSTVRANYLALLRFRTCLLTN